MLSFNSQNIVLNNCISVETAAAVSGYSKQYISRMLRQSNLVKELMIDHPDQVWVCDITYIRLGAGCALRKLLDQELILVALRMALMDQIPEIHHSDQGVQYATKTLQNHRVCISMAAVGKAEENGYAERLIRTIKEEEVALSDYRNFADAKNQIGCFIEDVYNHKRIHSSLGYLTPAGFEAHWLVIKLAEDTPLRKSDFLSGIVGPLHPRPGLEAGRIWPFHTELPWQD